MLPKLTPGAQMVGTPCAAKRLPMFDGPQTSVAMRRPNAASAAAAKLLTKPCSGSTR